MTDADRQTLAYILLLLAVASACFWAGWDLAVRRYNKRLASIAVGYQQLADQFQELSRFYDQDPARAGINTGVLYAISQMDTLVTEMKDKYRGNDE